MISVLIRCMFSLLLSTLSLSAFAAQSQDDVEKARQHISALATKALDGPQHYIVLHMPAGSDVKSGSEQLAGILDDIKRPLGLVLVIGSEDTTAMATIVKNGFATVRRQKLAGCVVIYVGSASEQLSVGKLVTRSGAEFRFVEFQP
jgi:hypothetical protein